MLIQVVPPFEIFLATWDLAFVWSVAIMGPHCYNNQRCHIFGETRDSQCPSSASFRLNPFSPPGTEHLYGLSLLWACSVARISTAISSAGLGLAILNQVHPLLKFLFAAQGLAFVWSVITVGVLCYKNQRCYIFGVFLGLTMLIQA